MRNYFVLYRNAFRRNCTLRWKQLAIFIACSSLAFVLMTAALFFGLWLIIQTPVLPYLTAPGVMQFTRYSLHVFQAVVLLPVVIHLLKIMASRLSAK